MDARKRATYLFWLIITILPIIGLVWSVLSPKDFETWQAISRQWIEHFGVFGPFIFVLIQAGQVIFTPISHYTVGAIGGYLYGPYLGGLLNFVGRIIGHLCAFEIARRLGRPFIEKHVNETTLRKYDRIISGRGQKSAEGGLQPIILFLIYFLPLFPDDEISYLVGASSMGRRSFILANLLGHLGGAFSLAYLGSGVSTQDPLFWVLTLSTLAGFPVIWGALRMQAKRQQKNRQDAA
jgi:uncharacterized membrane protein YdjX (TVP38/TMEM64 family)